jgi:hypothetical protein
MISRFSRTFFSIGGVLDEVIEEALRFREVLVLAGGLPEIVAGLGGVACFACVLNSGLGGGGIATRKGGTQGGNQRHLQRPSLSLGDCQRFVEGALRFSTCFRRSDGQDLVEGDSHTNLDGDDALVVERSTVVAALVVGHDRMVDPEQVRLHTSSARGSPANRTC